MAQNEEPEYCKRCDKWFANWDALSKHKIASKEHIACYVCAREFNTREGCTRHQHQVRTYGETGCLPDDLASHILLTMAGISHLFTDLESTNSQKDHATEQILLCVGCGQKFSRVGAYISHIEQHMCPVIHKEHFDRRREAQELWHKTAKTADMHPLATQKQASPELAFKNNDLSWESWPTQEGPSLENFNDFPTLPINDYRNGGSKVTDLLTGGPNEVGTSTFTWDNNHISSKTSFSDDPDATAPPVSNLPSLSAKPKTVPPGKVKEDVYIWHEYDPDNPKFNVEQYYNPYSQKYRCAWPGCR
jgi:hypothetical protein